MMQYAYPTALAVHVLSTIFWAGSSFVLARTNGAHMEVILRSIRPAIVIAMLSGAYLWYLSEGTYFGTSQRVLAVGIVAALLAAALQTVAIRRHPVRARIVPQGDEKSSSIALLRTAAGLLAITAVSMAVAQAV